jgi:hypothetical protein
MPNDSLHSPPAHPSSSMQPWKTLRPAVVSQVRRCALLALLIVAPFTARGESYFGVRLGVLPRPMFSPLPTFGVQFGIHFDTPIGTLGVRALAETFVFTGRASLDGLYVLSLDSSQPLVYLGAGVGAGYDVIGTAVQGYNEIHATVGIEFMSDHAFHFFADAQLGVAFRGEVSVNSNGGGIIIVAPASTTFFFSVGFGVNVHFGR